MRKPLLLLACTGSLALTLRPAGADDSSVPGEGFSAARYEALWTKSPFAVATADAVQESPDYSLVGIAEFDGVSYASLIERQSQEHFLISSDKPTRGLILTTITRSHDGSDTYAVVQKDGQPITLKLEQAPAMAAVPGAPQTTTVPTPGIVTPQIPMPGAGIPVFSTGSTRPLIRFHRVPIHLPPMPGQQQQPAQQEPPAQQQPPAQDQQPVQPHTLPPPLP